MMTSCDNFRIWGSLKDIAVRPLSPNYKYDPNYYYRQFRPSDANLKCARTSYELV